MLIIGDGILKSNYLTLIEKHNLIGNIHLPGQYENKETLGIISQAIAMIVPSRKEGLPYVPLEAGALSIPLIISGILPLREIVVENGRDGLIFEPENSPELAEKVLDLINNQKLHSQLSQTIFEIVKL